MQQITVCKWVEGQYEDTAFTGTSRIESDLIPNWERSIEQIFAIAPES
jgi:hypothetical protein